MHYLQDFDDTNLPDLGDGRTFPICLVQALPEAKDNFEKSDKVESPVL